MLDTAITSMSEYERAQEYIHFVNGKLQDHLFRHQDVRVLPSSQTSEEGPEIPWAAAPVPPIGTHPCRRRRGTPS